MTVKARSRYYFDQGPYLHVLNMCKKNLMSKPVKNNKIILVSMSRVKIVPSSTTFYTSFSQL